MSDESVESQESAVGEESAVNQEPAASVPAPTTEEQVAAPAEARCPACGASADPSARFCEECGAAMDGGAPAAGSAATAPAVASPAAARPCVRCGGTIAPDGYCEACGAPASSERDHFAIAVDVDLGGVCDRGVVHTRNEDAMAITAAGGVSMIVVCDGVSTAPASDKASLAACEAALAHLTTGATGGERAVGREGATSAWGSLLAEAAGRANEAVLAVPTEAEGDAPSCTYVAAVVDGPLVVVASVGDSRAYWLPDSGVATRLTTDDSWAQEMLELGMSPQQVERSPQAHAITRWLGPDAPELAPRTDTVTTGGPGWVLLCSDGLWNYCGDPDELGELVRRTAAEVGPAAADVAAALVEWANAQGGRDNVTVALARRHD